MPGVTQDARSTKELTPEFLSALKRMLEEAYGEPLNEDWDHALGGVHFFITEDDEPIAHASVVERHLEIGDQEFRTGYVESVATRPDRRRRGLASRVMQAATAHVLEEYHLGAMSTGENDFYGGLGWGTGGGPTFVRRPDGELVRTEDEDGGVMVLRGGASSGVDLD